MLCPRPAVGGPLTQALGQGREALTAIDYRVTREGDELAIREVFYDHHGKIQGWTHQRLSVSCSSVESLRHELQLYMQALDKPVIDVPNGDAA